MDGYAKDRIYIGKPSDKIVEVIGDCGYVPQLDSMIIQGYETEDKLKAELKKLFDITGYLTYTPTLVNAVQKLNKV